MQNQQEKGPLDQSLKPFKDLIWFVFFEYAGAVALCRRVTIVRIWSYTGHAFGGTYTASRWQKERAPRAQGARYGCQYPGLTTVT